MAGTIPFDRLIVKKNCPYCDGKAVLKRWGLKYSPGKIQFAVECKKCGIHSEIADTAKKAVRNWEKEAFSELQKKLTKKLDSAQIDSQNVAKVVGAILETTVEGFKDKYRIYLSMDHDDENFRRYKKEIESLEKDLLRTIDYWTPDVISEDVVKIIKNNVEGECCAK